MSSWREQYLERFYKGRPGWLNGSEEFHDLVRATIRPGAKILEIGSGPSNASSRFLATLGELHGVDITPELLENDALASGKVGDGVSIPYPDATFDACVSNYVLEHVEKPREQLREIFRVLKPGGAYLFRTPNLVHYVALISGATPQWLHELVANRVRGLAAGSHAPYPTVYRMNTPRAVRSGAKEIGFEVETLRMVEKEPSYGMIARPVFLGLMAYERLVNSTEKLAFARANLFAVLRKPGAAN
jgi:ubiquinone/menaquinone biosynthesis C-methylase UbiE